MVALALTLGTSALSQSSDVGGGGGGGIIGLLFMLIMLAVSVAVIAGFWKIFTKAGEPGWAVLVPIYNMLVWLKIAGKPAWWFLLFLIPGVGMIMAIIAAIAVAENFGKSTGFGIGLGLLAPIFGPMLGFSDAVYQGGAGARRAA